MTYEPPSLPATAALTAAWMGAERAAPPVICHRMRAAGLDGLAPALLRRGMAIIAVRRPMTGGRGAVGRALCLPNRASHPCTCVGLLRRAWFGMRGDGAVKMWAKDWLDTALGVDAGASGTKGLTGVLRASRHASPTTLGPLRPLKPCMNGLPAHAPVTFDRRYRPVRLHICPTSTGVEKLH